MNGYQNTELRIVGWDEWINTELRRIVGWDEYMLKYRAKDCRMG